MEKRSGEGKTKQKTQEKHKKRQSYRRRYLYADVMLTRVTAQNTNKSTKLSNNLSFLRKDDLLSFILLLLKSKKKVENMTDIFRMDRRTHMFK